MPSGILPRLASLMMLASLAPAAQAQFGGLVSMPHVAVGLVGSTLGIGGDVAFGLGKHVVLRGAQHAGSIGANRSFSNQPYQLFAKADNRSFMMDVHPFGGGIYLSAGKVINKSTIALTSTPIGGSYTVNGQAYAADSIGNIVGAITLPENSWFYGLGWDHTFGNSWPASLTSRVGVLRQDRVKLALSATGPYGQTSNPAYASFQTELDAERVRQEQSASDQSIVKNMPVIELGLRLRLF
ncbi:MAG: hypothetical protein ABIV10_15195 [Gemmatimonadaceae bacterium]